MKRNQTSPDLLWASSQLGYEQGEWVNVTLFIEPAINVTGAFSFAGKLIGDDKVSLRNIEIAQSFEQADKLEGLLVTEVTGGMIELRYISAREAPSRFRLYMRENSSDVYNLVYMGM